MVINIAPPFQTHFTIETNCSTLTNSLLLKHGNYATISEYLAKTPIRCIKENNTYCLNFEECTITTDTPFTKIEDYMYHHRKYGEDIFPIHGGAVEFDNQAHLIVAPSTGGKTTLTSYLTTNGFGYITDDCILLDRKNFNVHPYHTPLHLREGGYQVLKALDCLPNEIQLLDDVAIKRYVYTPINRIVNPIPLSKILFITRVLDNDRYEPMSTTEKMSALLHSPIRSYPMSKEYLIFISKLARIPCYRLFYKDMNFVAEVIRNE